MKPKNQIPVIIHKSTRSYTPDKAAFDQMEKRRRIARIQEERALSDEIKEVWE